MKSDYAIGIDLGGTSVKYGICSLDGELLEQFTAPTPAEASRERILSYLTELIRRTQDIARKKKIDISAVGMGTPGSVDVRRGYLMGGTPNFVNWKDVDIRPALESVVHLPVFVDNDANLMAYGEFLFGAGKAKQNAVCVTLGTGIGGGIIIEGEIYRGSFFAGAEIGHMCIEYQGRPCKCGGNGCWETYASATAMVQDYNLACPENPVSDTRQIFDRYHSGDETAVKIVQQVIVYLGAGLASLINIFNPEIIILGGGVSQAGEWFIKKISRAAFRRAMAVSRKHVEIRAAQLGNRAGMLGAAAFALKMVNSGKR